MYRHSCRIIFIFVVREFRLINVFVYLSFEDDRDDRFETCVREPIRPLKQRLLILIILSPIAGQVFNAHSSITIIA